MIRIISDFKLCKLVPFKEIKRHIGAAATDTQQDLIGSKMEEFWYNKPNRNKQHTAQHKTRKHPATPKVKRVESSDDEIDVDDFENPEPPKATTKSKRQRKIDIKHINIFQQFDSRGTLINN